MCDRQIANIDISKEYDESLGTDDVHYQSFARMAALRRRQYLMRLLRSLTPTVMC